ncbi:Metallo-dependent phosphatase-like protein, partial [Linnemannia elongata]
IVIIADPQLTDWYSYKQTGLALWLTEFYTDLFMRKSFARLHRRLQPDMVLFLGDLLDGGRETVAGHDRGVYEKNKHRFLDKIRQDGKSARLYVAGNHDVGFGDTLVRQAMKRYKGDFGSVNYEIKVGNHSLVVLDTLSLSSNITSVREESRGFLARMEQEKSKEPRVLFTHVPLFRPETTSCGEAREAQQLILDRNGEQYQNMVNASLSREILRKVQPDMIFSGDDHDWCEMGHSLDGRLTPEVTLPTFSFAQGIKQPGFVVLSL